MDKVPKKEVEEGASKDQQKKTGEKLRSLKFTFKDKRHGATYDTSHTVFGALNTNKGFMASITKEQKLEQKDIVFIRDDGKGAAVNTDFPCVLLKPNEILKITFINKKGKTKQPSNKNHSHRSEDLVSFNVKTRGGDKVKLLMRNNALVTTAEVEYICVYAVKGETFKTALKRDKRFSDVIFRKSCALSDCTSDTIHQMSEYVDDHYNKQFKVIVNKNPQRQDSQDSQDSEDTPTSSSSITNTASLDASENTEDQRKHHPTNIQQENTEQSTSASGSSVKWKPIQGSDDILKLLREQFKDLQQQLKCREKLRDNAEVKKFFREEYDKSVQSFSEVKKAREIMRLCDSVCQIRKDGSARGTGFLLFDRYVLTNAHVIGIFNLTEVNASDFTAVFGYEDLDQNGTKHVQIKNLITYFHGKDDKGNHLDYALLELTSVDQIAGYPQLYNHYRRNTPNNRSEICIVGHPDSVKKMDPCFIIGRDNQSEAEDKHISENNSFHQVMKQESLKEKWDFHQNQITYDSCFFDGSSGSPVFDADCKLIGIHTGGYVYKGHKTRSVMEYAYDMQPILDNIKAKARFKSMQDIVNILEGKSNEGNVSSTEEQQNQTDVEMESEEDSIG